MEGSFTGVFATLREDKQMYSPKIADEFIPSLYRLAKARKMPMTRLVDGMIRDALASTTPPENATANPSGLYVRESEPRKAVA